MQKTYILKVGSYYLSEINKSFDDNHNIVLVNYEIDNNFRKLYSDFELAEDDRKLIFIETGLNLEVKLFKEEE